MLAIQPPSYSHKVMLFVLCIASKSKVIVLLMACFAAGQPAASSSAPAKTELVLGRKWTVENHKGNKQLVIDQTDPKQSVYIYNCHNSTVQVGPVNSSAAVACSMRGLCFRSQAWSIAWKAIYSKHDGDGMLALAASVSGLPEIRG